MVANIHCSFRGGKIHVSETRRIAGQRKLRLLGSGWRGVVFMAAATLLYLELWELGLLILAGALLWSLVAGAIKKWRRILTQQRVLLLLRQGRVDLALTMSGEPEPLSLIWWQHLYSLFREGEWSKATRYLETIEGEKERDYLLALAYLGQNMPTRALALCPPRPQEKWQLLKAQAHFQLHEWKKVLSTLRGGKLDAAQVVECNWLKGGSYYYLGQYKPAVKLLRQVLEQQQEAYAEAEVWLQIALTKLE